MVVLGSECVRGHIPAPQWDESCCATGFFFLLSSVFPGNAPGNTGRTQEHLTILSGAKFCILDGFSLLRNFPSFYRR